MSSPTDDPAPAAVLDTSAVIAFLVQENGWEKVEPYLTGGLLSTVNLSEIISKFAERGMDLVQLKQDILDLDLELVDFTLSQARICGELRPTTKTLGLSLGDRACLALGLEKKAKVITADKNWDSLPLPHQIEVIR